MKKLFMLILILGSIFFVIPKNLLASEGDFNLKNIVGENARCSARSVLMSNQRYNILVSCRDILYPGGTQVFTYVAWAVTNEGDFVKLGELGTGKAEFQSKESFTSMFVTKELTGGVRNPEGQRIMQGGLEIISLLDNPGNTVINTTSLTGANDNETPIETEETTQPQKRSAINLFRIGGIIAAVVVFSGFLIGLVITRR